MKEGREKYDLEEEVNFCGMVSNRYDIAVTLELSAADYQEDLQRTGPLSLLLWRGEGRGLQGLIHINI